MNGDKTFLLHEFYVEDKKKKERKIKRGSDMNPKDYTNS